VDTTAEDVVESCLTLLSAMHTVSTPAICQMDVTMSQVKAMLTIAMKSTSSVGEIAQVCGVGLPAASTTVDRLVDRGWVDRAEDPNDRRRTLVRLSEEGEQVVETIWRLRRDLLRSWMNRLDQSDLNALAQGVRALTAAAQDSARKTAVTLEPVA
jgi:DNA-binding MarR family transcriptional regulator